MGLFPILRLKISLRSHLVLTGRVAQELRDLPLRPESVGLNLIF